MALHVLSDRDTSIVVDDSTGVPSVLHWGGRVGEVTDAVARTVERIVVPATIEDRSPPPLAAANTTSGRPGIELHTAEGPLWPRFGPPSVDVAVDVAGGGDPTLAFRTADPALGLVLSGAISLGHTARLSLSVRNEGPTTVWVDHLAVTVPVPDDADEVLRFDGHWCKELTPVRATWEGSSVVIDNRRGRTSHDHVPVVFAGRRGFGEHAGRVHAVHLAWSGNTELRLDHHSDGRRTIQAAELLVPGEVRLAPGETYDTPTVHAVTAIGLSRASRHFHDHVRTRLPERPRPVTLNTWEAVYFDHDRATLFALAERAARVGVERFVLDDGWFGGRRDDTAGLGDWWVSPDAHPDGLVPLTDHVRSLDMEFGLWVEPEMVNRDSELFRAHPDWVLGDPHVVGRHQLVLDLSIEECWQHLRDALDRLLADHDIAYLKWDHNRDVVGAGSHRQTVALYRLLDALRAAHPDVEIESCASGGGRADLAILERTARVWTSDCNDALERQTIQRGFGHLFPPAVMGAHIGPPRAHTTGRTQRLHFRAATALFGHLGIEWNLLEASDRHLDALAWWIATHKSLRPLLHGGEVVRLDSPDPSGAAHGVVSTDRSEGLFCWAQLAQSVRSHPPRLRFADLDPERTYRVEHLGGPGEVLGLARPPAWMHEPVDVPGAWLQEAGLQLPLLHPESALLIRLHS